MYSYEFRELPLSDSNTSPIVFHLFYEAFLRWCGDDHRLVLYGFMEMRQVLYSREIRERHPVSYIFPSISSMPSSFREASKINYIYSVFFIFILHTYEIMLIWNCWQSLLHWVPLRFISLFNLLYFWANILTELFFIPVSLSYVSIKYFEELLFHILIGGVIYKFQSLLRELRNTLFFPDSKT